MTAQVAVLTTSGAALASDSAVTVTGGGQSRSYQSADKVFPVPGVPVAVLHSGNADLLGVPWQILHETWAAQRGDAQLPSVRAYADELVAWLTAQDRLLTESAQDGFFRWTVRDYFLAIRARVREVGGGEGYLEGAAAEALDTVVDSFEHRLGALAEYDGADRIDAAEVCRRLGPAIGEDLEWVFDDTPRTHHLEERARPIAERLTRAAEPFVTDAVLAFVGYGADDYFPSLHRVTVAGALDGVVRCYDRSDAVVTREARVSITPLGQTGAIHAFVRGSSPQYRTAAHDALDALAGQVDRMRHPDRPRTGADQNAHAQLDATFDEIEWEQFLSPMLDVVETLPLAETVRLADALVGLASLRQLVQGTSTVGGPIDLARITRSGGFAWVRTKADRPYEP